MLGLFLKIPLSPFFMWMGDQSANGKLPEIPVCHLTTTWLVDVECFEVGHVTELEKQFLSQPQSSHVYSITVYHSVLFDHKSCLDCSLLFYKVWYHGQIHQWNCFHLGHHAFFWGCTYHTCLQQTACRLPLRCVTMFLLYRFKPFGIKCYGIPCLYQWTVPRELSSHVSGSSKRTGEMK